MSILILDSGALIALENNDRAMWALLGAAYDSGEQAQVPAGVIGEVCHGGPTQARLNQALKKCKVISLDGPMARIVGNLRVDSGVNDVVDASVMVTAAMATALSSVAIATSDMGDMTKLRASARRVPKLVRNTITLMQI